jgi:uncharacterized protein YbaR (Trm112 family)
MTFLVRCPDCKQTMKMKPRKRKPKDAVKKCVYCNRSFKIHKNVRDSQIIKDLRNN